jgi:hypothetical protein
MRGGLPANWSSGNVPGASDDVIINRSAALTVTVSSGSQSVNSIQTTSTDSLVISAGSLTVAAASQIAGPFTMNDPSAAITGPITLTGTSQWTAGAMLGNIINSGTLMLSGADGLTGGSILNNAGTITQTGTGLFTLDSSTLNNLAGAVYDFQGDGGWQGGFYAGHDGYVNNSGMIRKSAGAGTTSIYIVLSNTGGTIEAQSGTVNLQTVGGNSTGGVFKASNGAVVALSGTMTLTGTYTGAGAVDCHWDSARRFPDHEPPIEAPPSPADVHGDAVKDHP